MSAVPTDDDLPRTLLPQGWPRPQGYANGMTAKGRVVVTGGVVGWDVMGNFPDSFAGQARQTFFQHPRRFWPKAAPGRSIWCGSPGT